MNSQTKGSAAEHIASGALLLNGYEVYWNTTPFGLSDLIAQKDHVLYRVQVKSFYSKKVHGPYRTEKSVYKVAECRTSNMANGDYHQPYKGLVDAVVIVDTETGEVFWIPDDHRKSQIHKNAILEYRIFPTPD